MKKKQIRKIFWGIMFLLGAITLLLGQDGISERPELPDDPFSVVFTGLLADGLLAVSFGQILFSLAFPVILNDRLLHLEAITSRPVLGAALPGMIGLNIIFPRHWKNKSHPFPPHSSNTGRPVESPELS